MKNQIKDAIENYYNKLNPNVDYYEYEDFSKTDKKIKKLFCNGKLPVKRYKKTDLTAYSKEFGYDLPKEIKDYINFYWHSHIMGYYNYPECIILFSVLKNEGDKDDDVLLYECNLIDLARKWNEIGDINRYVPIGWVNYSGAYVLYEISTKKIYIEDMDANIDGVVSELPIANNLAELINNLKT